MLLLASFQQNDNLVSNRHQQFVQADAMQHLCPHPVDDSEGNLSPVLGRIDVDAKRTFAEGGVHDLYDCLCNFARIGIFWNDGGKASWIFFPYPL